MAITRLILLASKENCDIINTTVTRHKISIKGWLIKTTGKIHTNSFFLNHKLSHWPDKGVGYSQYCTGTGYLIACTSPTFWALFLNAVQTEIPELCTTKLCRFYEAVPPSPASHELRICKMSVLYPCCPLLPLDRENRLVVMALNE